LEGVRLELAVEYAGLFLGVWGRPAHPSESAYASGGRLTMQVQRDEVLAMYRAAGVDKAKAFTEPEDHVALELHFMSYMAGEAAKAAASGDVKETLKRLEAQQDFLNKHLGQWIGMLANDVVKQGKVAFYKGVSLIAEGFVEEDSKALADLVSEFKS
jgi:TorA maturation chaperone TorD